MIEKSRAFDSIKFTLGSFLGMFIALALSIGNAYIISQITGLPLYSKYGTLTFSAVTGSLLSALEVIAVLRFTTIGDTE